MTDTVWEPQEEYRSVFELNRNKECLVHNSTESVTTVDPYAFLALVIKVVVSFPGSRKGLEEPSLLC